MISLALFGVVLKRERFNRYINKLLNILNRYSMADIYKHKKCSHFRNLIYWKTALIFKDKNAF